MSKVPLFSWLRKVLNSGAYSGIFSRGGGLHFFFFTWRGRAPVGAWKSPEITRLPWSRGGGWALIVPPPEYASCLIIVLFASYTRNASHFCWKPANINKQILDKTNMDIQLILYQTTLLRVPLWIGYGYLSIKIHFKLHLQTL